MCQNYMGVWIFTMNRQCCIEAECLGLQRVHICVGLFHIRRISCCFKFARSGVFHIRRIRCLMKKPTILAVKTTPHIDTGDAS